MGRLIACVIFLIVILTLLHVFGTIDSGPVAYVIDSTSNLSNLKNTDYFTKAQGVIVGATIGAIVIGTWAQGATELVLVAPMAIFLFFILSDFVALYQTLSTVSVALARIIIAPLIFVVIIIIFEWWRGKDG